MSVPATPQLKQCKQPLTVSVSSEPKEVITFEREEETQEEKDCTRWSVEEVEYLVQHRGDNTQRIAEELGRSYRAVEKKRVHLGNLVRENRDHWCVIEEEYLWANYWGLTVPELAQRMGRTEPSVKTKIIRMGITKEKSRAKTNT